MDHLASITAEINNLRQLEYFVKHELFKRLYKGATDSERFIVNKYIETRNVKSVKTWIDNQRDHDINTMKLVDLRQAAKDLQISKVDRYNKDQLISLILDKRKGMP